MGFAHIGAIQALEEHNIQIDCLAGTSMGAIIATFYAAGYSPIEILEIIEKTKLYKRAKLVHKSTNRLGLSSHKSLRQAIEEFIPHNSFDSLQKPLYVCVSNLNDASSEFISTGDLLSQYVAASAAIPGIFEPSIIGEKIFVDGGVINNMPTQALREQCQVVIGVDVVPYFTRTEAASTTEMLFFALRAMLHQNSQEGRKQCDFLIESIGIKQYTEADFKRYRELFQYGYNAMMKYIEANPEMLSRCRQE